MTVRTIAIGDIHGCSLALAALIQAINPQPEDTIVTLGDYVDRGIDSKGVLDQLIDLAGHCQLVPILGNHDEMMLHARDGRSDLQFWLNCGGGMALDSYGMGEALDLVPPEHFRFLESCVPYHQTDSHIFLHANYKPDLPIESFDENTLRWLSLRDYLPPAPHCSGKTVIVGHTPRSEILDLGYLKCIDTACCDGNWLSAMDVETGVAIQVNEVGELNGSVAGAR